MTQPALVFVYNVDASPVALLRDLYSGLTTGSTDCNLCDLTFGTLLKDRSWRRFVDRLPVAVDFELRSTFRRHHPDLAQAGFPSAWWVRPGERPWPAIEAPALNAVGDLAALRTMVERVVRAGPGAPSGEPRPV